MSNDEYLGILAPILIGIVIGLLAGLSIGYAVGSGYATPVVGIPLVEDPYYDNACINWNYVKGTGAGKSDYYFDTDRESCQVSCSRINTTEQGSMAWQMYSMHCGCCKARGQYP